MSLRRALRASLLLSHLCAAVAVSQASFEAEAQAAEQRMKVAVGGFANDKKGEIRDAFIAALRSDGGYDITDAEDVKSTANARSVAEAAKAMDVAIVITGKVVGTTLKLKVMDTDGAPLDEADIKGASRAKLKTSIQNTAAFSIADGVDKVRAKAAAAEQAEREKAAQAKAEAHAEDSSDDDTSGGLSPFDLTAGLRALHRSFTFHDSIAERRPNDGFGRFLKYKLPLGPEAFVDVNWYPGAHFARGQAERIGISAGYQKGFAITTKYQPEGAAEQKLQTNEHGFYVGARYRLPIAAHRFGAGVSYGQHTFQLQGDEAAPLVPDVKYSYLKLGLDGTLQLGALSIGARVGKRFVLGTGELESVWFPGSVKTQSLEAGATIGWRLSRALHVVGGFDWLRYAFDFNPVPRRAGFESAVAGGAVDEYLSGFVGLRVQWPDGEEAAPERSPAPSPAQNDEE